MALAESGETLLLARSALALSCLSALLSINLPGPLERELRFRYFCLLVLCSGQLHKTSRVEGLSSRPHACGFFPCLHAADSLSSLQAGTVGAEVGGGMSTSPDYTPIRARQ